MKRLLVIVVSMLIVLSFISSANAAFFSLREGIEWYMSKDQVIKCLKKEADFDSYIVIDYFEDVEGAAEYVSTLFPYERNNRQMWILNVYNVSLGKSNEEVMLLLGGTNKTGLYMADYSITLNSKNEDDVYSRFIELKIQLEKKYGEFGRDYDKWNNRKSVKAGENVCFYYAYAPKLTGKESNITKSLIEAEGKTLILLILEKDENSGYSIRIEYQSPRTSEIEQSMKDGSFYVTTPYGL